MSLLTVDPENCNRDGICVEVCPMGIIEMKSKDAFPALIDGGEKVCINCGHCVAACPAGAMNHAVMNSEDCVAADKYGVPDPEQVQYFLRSRRSIRKYRLKTVEREVLFKLIDLGRYAPSGHNLQPVNWLVIHNRDEVQRLAGLVIDWMRYMIKEQSPLVAAMHLDRVVAFWDGGADAICRSAPHLIVAHARKMDRTAPPACTLALSYLELAAPSFGLGCCWAGFFNVAANVWPPMQEALDLPEGHISFGALMIGYPKYKYQRLPLRKQPVIIWR